MKFVFVLGLAAMASAVRKYDGPLPPQFDSKQMGDAFMESTIRKYGEVTKKEDQQRIYISKANARKLAWDVWTGALDERPYDTRNHLDANFDQVWSHFDVLHEDKIYVDQLPGFYRMLKSDTGMQLN